MPAKDVVRIPIHSMARLILGELAYRRGQPESVVLSDLLLKAAVELVDRDEELRNATDGVVEE